MAIKGGTIDWILDSYKSRRLMREEDNSLDMLRPDGWPMPHVPKHRPTFLPKKNPICHRCKVGKAIRLGKLCEDCLSKVEVPVSYP